jgi:hypothetical protein
MKILAIAIILLLLAIYFVQAVAVQVFVNDYVKPRSLFASLLEATLISAVAALAINISIPE